MLLLPAHRAGCLFWYTDRSQQHSELF
jgi:hypothetical protein